MMEMEGVGRWPFWELEPPFDEELGLLLPADLVLIEPITSDHRPRHSVNDTFLSFQLTALSVN